MFQLGDKTEVENYMDRFKYENWSSLVQLVIEEAGPCLASPIAQFNNVIDDELKVF